MSEIRFAPYFGTEKPIIGSPDGANVEVETFEHNGELEFNVRCMCAACYQIDQVGIVEAMGDVEPNTVYYMEAWFAVYPSGPWGAEEYDGGIRVHEASSDD